MVKNLNLLGIDPGGTTGWALFVVPRASIYGRGPSQILEWDYGELSGREEEQVKDICRLAIATQSMDYKVGVAVVTEDWDQDPKFKSTDREALSPVRIGAMLRYAQFCNQMHDSRVIMQGRVIAKETFTDERLKQAKYYVEGSDHIRDAIRHGLTALRRAKASAAFREQCWYDDSKSGLRDY